VILSTNKGLRGSKKTSVLFSHGFNKACLIPDSYRATERNGNSISVDFTEYSIKNDENDACFCPFLTIWQLSWTFYFTLQYKHNIRTLSVNIKLTNLLSLSPRNRSEKFAKEYFLYLFLTLIQINIIFCDDVCILYIYCSNGQNLCVGEKSLLHK
jgi:hypothetical protein